jgi:hypothetical protein
MKGIDLPAPVQRYLDADSKMDDELFASCFVPDAQVRDEGRTIHGLAAIKAWKQDSRKKYRYTVQPLSLSQEAGTTVLTACLTGDFPGSPVELAYRFVLRDDRIAELDIH